MSPGDGGPGFRGDEQLPPGVPGWEAAVDDVYERGVSGNGAWSRRGWRPGETKRLSVLHGDMGRRRELPRLGSDGSCTTTTKNIIIIVMHLLFKRGIYE